MITTSASTWRKSRPAFWQAVRSRRLIRLRSVAWPTRLVTVSPKRRPQVRLSAGGPGPSSAPYESGGPRPPRRSLARFVRRADRSCATLAHRAGLAPRSGRQALAAVGAASSDDLAATLGRHAGTEAMAALANELARLIRPLHVTSPVRDRRRGAIGGAFPSG